MRSIQPPVAQTLGLSLWDEGDWNGDGEFDSSDLVLVFQLGHYENPGHSPPHERVIDLIFADN